MLRLTRVTGRRAFTLYRLVLSRYKDEALAGEGGLHYSGRWHIRGTRVAYTSDAVALALLETLVHTDASVAPRYHLLQIAVPQGMNICAVDSDSLPKNWRETECSPECQRAGRDWLDRGEAALLQVPSAVVPEQYNFVLNVSHKDFSRLKTISNETYSLDRRLLSSRSY